MTLDSNLLSDKTDAQRGHSGCWKIYMGACLHIGVCSVSEFKSAIYTTLVPDWWEPRALQCLKTPQTGFTTDRPRWNRMKIINASATVIIRRSQWDGFDETRIESKVQKKYLDITLIFSQRGFIVEMI